MQTRVHNDRAELGRSAAADIAADLAGRLAAAAPGAGVRVVFAAAPSQQEMLDALVEQPGIDWSRVTAFHMDEYVDLPADAPQRFARWLDTAIFERVPFGAVHRIDPARDPADYAALLAEAPIDVVCCGIGVNGHLAFNDPPVADLADPLDVKVVELDEICRRQQVDDGCFPDLAAVPRRAVTLTVPRLLRCERVFCVVPGAAKAPAVRRTLRDEISEACPATALRTHPDCTLYLDRESADELALD